MEIKSSIWPVFTRMSAVRHIMGNKTGGNLICRRPKTIIEARFSLTKDKMMFWIWFLRLLKIMIICSMRLIYLNMQNYITFKIKVIFMVM